MKIKLFLVLWLLFAWNGLVLANEKIDINTAPIEDLVKIIHIGEKRALEIIALRPFYSLDDLIKVKGIGEKTLFDIKAQGIAQVNLKETSVNSTPPPISVTEPLKPMVNIYPFGVVINEILPYPEGPDATDEWIELFNQNNFEINLSGWAIKDTFGKITIYTFPEGTKIISNDFLLLPRPTTKITLNNNEDGLELLHPNGNIVNSVNYNKAPKGQSYNKVLNDVPNEAIEDNWFWGEDLTPNQENNLSSFLLEQEEKISREKMLAEINQPLSLLKTNTQSSILFIALGIAIFSGTIILLLKKNR